MTVSELIDFLSLLPKDTEIILYDSERDFGLPKHDGKLPLVTELITISKENNQLIIGD